jgi:hypothetical protein
VFSLEQEWWKESQNGVLGAVEQDALRQSLFDDGASGDVKLQPLNQAAAANFEGYRKAIRQRFQLLL